MKKFGSPAVVAVFKAYPAPLRAKLLAVRQLIFETAANTPGVGRLAETLKWGQPSYLTEETGSGSTVRIDARRSGTEYAVYFHCQSGLVAAFRELYGDRLAFEGKRAIVLATAARLPRRELAHCIGLALTHHRRRRAVSSVGREARVRA
jgi:hypothetical protein